MTIKNAVDAQEFSENRFTKKPLFQEGKTTAFVLNFLPGQTLPPHPHPNSHVYLYVIEGSGICIIDGQEHKISEKDVIHAEDQQILSIENNGDDSPKCLRSIGAWIMMANP